MSIYQKVKYAKRGVDRKISRNFRWLLKDGGALLISSKKISVLEVTNLPITEVSVLMPDGR